MIEVVSNTHLVDNDLLDVAHLFYSDFEEFNFKIEHFYFELDQNTMKNVVIIEGKETCEINEFDNSVSPLIRKRMIKRNAKVALYRALQSHTGIKMPWGSLTGIRPTRLYYQLIEEGIDDVDKEFEEHFNVSKSKMKLLKSILNSQKGLLNNSENNVCVYVGIPFCVSKCSYCSFVSAVVSKCDNLIDDYVKCLVSEINDLKQHIKDKNFKVNAVYVGGGTPTALSDRHLEIILEACKFDCQEFTVEAGRPDTITKEKLDIIAQAGANRISINPQTFCDKTLKEIGRNHQSKDIFEKMQLAKDYDFIVNMDLIAGLPNENFEVFQNSLEQAILLNPDNITVHTLALKKGSDLKIGGFKCNSGNVGEMVDYSIEKLSNSGYLPYYMYRQKYMHQNLENVGYGKSGTFCKYNIDIMEENTSILACGANGISKRIFPLENRLERCANAKDIKTYINSIDKILLKKRKLFDN